MIEKLPAPDRMSVGSPGRTGDWRGQRELPWVFGSRPGLRLALPRGAPAHTVGPAVLRDWRRKGVLCVLLCPQTSTKRAREFWGLGGSCIGTQRTLRRVWRLCVVAVRLPPFPVLCLTAIPIIIFPLPASPREPRTLFRTRPLGCPRQRREAHLATGRRNSGSSRFDVAGNGEEEEEEEEGSEASRAGAETLRADFFEGRVFQRSPGP